MHALSRRVYFGFGGGFASRARMSSPAARVGGGGGVRDPSENPAVGRLRELVKCGEAADGWEKSWESGVTPWDLGKPTPIIEHLVKSGTLPKGRALVPGCGMGYDVVALASPERFVVGLDISSTAMEKAKQISDQEAGPPFNNAVTDYQKVLEPLGFKAVLMEDNELAIKPRKGQEKLGRWKRFGQQSSL
uniref:Methyltransferase domain-containing protein n=1 Tax=Leersia perrieri TaxID=77586 RepID=A0A0D9WM19_9ORYZ